jgi:glycosyltransferase involved in cell wall biosynthesis
MKIAHVTNLYVPASLGGAEVNCFELVKHQRANGHTVRIITNEIGATFEDPDVVNLEQAVNPISIALLYPQASVDKALARALDEFSPDVVHVHNVHRTLGFGTYGQISKWPSVATIQDYHLFCLKTDNTRIEGQACNDRRFCSSCAATFYPNQLAELSPDNERWIETIGLIAKPFWPLVPALRNSLRSSRFSRAIDAVICPSSAMRDTMTLWGVPAEKMYVIGNAVQLDTNAQHLPADNRSGPITFGYIGKLTRSKGVHVLLDAFRMMECPDSDARLLVAGDGPDGKRLREKGAAVEGVTFLGRIGRDDIDGFYRSVDAIVVPSIWPDVMPLVVLEAMARGKAVIVAGIGGMPEQVAEAGIVVESNSAESLLRAMKGLTREKCAQLGEIARARFADHFEPAHLARETEALYERILIGPGRTIQHSVH